MLMVVSSLT